MELRRAAEVLLRSHTSPLAVLLAPATSSTWHRKFNGLSVVSAHRCIHSSRRLGADSKLQPPTTTSAGKPAVEGKGQRVKSSTPLDWLESETQLNRGGPQLAQSTAGERLFKNLNKGNSATDLLEGFKQTPRDRTNRFNLDRMESPMPLSRAADLMKSMTQNILAIPKPEKIPIKLNSKTGRTVGVGGGVDIGQALRLLDRTCARNSVRWESNKQRFHERPGLKRKRLRVLRWRRKFKEAFQATVKRVTKLRKQGW